MRRAIFLILLAALLGLPARAEFRRIDLAIFGMD
jgi:hypothetical protein